MTQKLFLLPPFLLELSLLMYFPFVTFITLISTSTRKSLLHFFHSQTEREIGFTTEFALVMFVTLVMGDMTIQKFFCNLCFFLSHQTACIFYSYFCYTDFFIDLFLLGDSWVNLVL